MLAQLTHNIKTTKNYLNISIKNVDKVIKDEHIVKELLNQNVMIYSKTDGVKISILRNDNEWGNEWYDMFVASYKNNIIYDTEFIDVENYNTVGESQYKVITDHIKDNYKNWGSIPKNTESYG